MVFREKYILCLIFFKNNIFSFENLEEMFPLVANNEEMNIQTFVTKNELISLEVKRRQLYYQEYNLSILKITSN